MFYAAKEFVTKRSRTGPAKSWLIGYREGWREGWQQGYWEARQQCRQEGQLAERERINQAVAAQGIPISPELAKILADDPS